MLQTIQCPRNSNDVLLGRGGNNNKYPGNEQLRIFARSFAKQYSGSGKLDKSELSRTLVTQVRQLDPPGRFLKQEQFTKVWADVGDIAARAKTSQVLRDAVSSLHSDYRYDARRSSSHKTNCPPASQEAPKIRVRKQADNQIKTKAYTKRHQQLQRCQNENTSVILELNSAIVSRAKNPIKPSTLTSSPNFHHFKNFTCRQKRRRGDSSQNASYPWLRDDIILSSGSIGPSTYEHSPSCSISRFSFTKLNDYPFDSSHKPDKCVSPSIDDIDYKDLDPIDWLPNAESFDDISRWGGD